MANSRGYPRIVTLIVDGDVPHSYCLGAGWGISTDRKHLKLPK